MNIELFHVLLQEDVMRNVNSTKTLFMYRDADFDFTETTLGLVTDDNAESAVNVFTLDC